MYPPRALFAREVEFDGRAEAEAEVEAEAEAEAEAEQPGAGAAEAVEEPKCLRGRVCGEEVGATEAARLRRV